MSTWKEARDAKATRLAREHRLYTRSNLGKACRAGCGLRVPQALNDAGIYAHPCCGPSELLLTHPEGRP